MTKDGPLYHQYSDITHDRDKYEFYTPNYKFNWFKVENDVYAAVYEGNRFYELHPDGSQYLIYNPRTHTSGVTSRMQGMFRNVTLTVRKRRRANGASQMKLYYSQYEYVPGAKHAQTREVASGIVMADRRIKVSAKEGKIFFEAVDDGKTVQHVKDNTKYREFNKRLKTLRATMVTQAKMGAYNIESELPRYQYYTTDRKLKLSLKEALGQYIKPDHHNTISWKAIEDSLYRFVVEWTQTSDAKLLRPIALCCFHNHTSESADAVDKAVRRIKSGLAFVQKQYLRRNCVTIVASNNSLSPCDDQNSELLPSPGLREVQVPGEAQVC